MGVGATALGRRGLALTEVEDCRAGWEGGAGFAFREVECEMPVELHMEMWEGSCWTGESGFRDKVLAENVKLCSSTCGGNLGTEEDREDKGPKQSPGHPSL